MKTTRFTVRLPEEVRSQLLALAERTHRTASNVAELCISKGITDWNAKLDQHQEEERQRAILIAATLDARLPSVAQTDGVNRDSTGTKPPTTAPAAQQGVRRQTRRPA